MRRDEHPGFGSCVSSRSLARRVFLPSAKRQVSPRCPFCLFFPLPLPCMKAPRVALLVAPPSRKLQSGEKLQIGGVDCKAAQRRHKRAVANMLSTSFLFRRALSSFFVHFANRSRDRLLAIWCPSSCFCPVSWLALRCSNLWAGGPPTEEQRHDL